MTYSSEEKRLYIEEYKRLDLSISAYVKQKNIPKSTFRDWLKKENTENTETFGELKFEEIKEPVFALATDKIKIELKDGYSKSLLQEILEVILRNDK